MAKQHNWDKIRKQSPTETLRNRDVYETQQLDRTPVGHKETFTVRHIIAIVLAIMTVVLVWCVASVFDIATLDNKSLEDANLAIVITSPAPDTPRQLDALTWLNMLLVPDNNYADYGYYYKDTHTNAKYTKAEYDLWLDYQRMFTEGRFPQIIQKNNDDGTYYYYERDPMNKAPRTDRTSGVWSVAKQVNMVQGGIEEDYTYYDLGYSYRENFYGTYLTAKEAQALQKYTSDYIEQLVNTQRVAYSVEQIDGNERYIFRDINKKSDIVPQLPEAPAGDRYTVPTDVSDLTYANMILVPNEDAAIYGYSYVDTRTGKFYTQVEYEKWKEIKDKAWNYSDGYIYWIEYSDTDGEVVYSETPAEPAPSEPRKFFYDLTAKDYIFMNMWQSDYWSRYGYKYMDPYTHRFYTDAEYALWATFQNQIAMGEIHIPLGIQNEIRSGKYNVTDIVKNSLDPLPEKHTYEQAVKYVSLPKVGASLVIGLIVYALLVAVFKKGLEVQNALNDGSDINQWENDQHIALPEEVQIKFDWFPDVGGHCPIMVSSMISHMMLNNKGIKKVKVAERAKEDIKDAEGNILYYKGDILLDDNGEPKVQELPFFDEQFGADLYAASGAPKEVQKWYRPDKIRYNPDGSDRTKQLGTHKTVADAINASWEFPIYEPQRPAGAYMVDTEPVNTMVLAITRAGKGKYSPVCSVTSKLYTLIALNS